MYFLVPISPEKDLNLPIERSMSPPPKSKPVEIWRGVINMVDVAQISITAHEVSGENISSFYYMQYFHFLHPYYLCSQTHLLISHFYVFGKYHQNSNLLLIGGS